MYVLDKSKWSKFIKIYEEFIRGIPDNFKDIIAKVRKDIGSPQTSFEKILDLEEYGMVRGVKIRIDVDFKFSELSNYYSNINIFELLNPQESEKLVNIPINIRDSNINIDKLISVIAHEIRHIYDVYLVNDESDMESFIKSLYLYKLRKKVFSEEFGDFLDLVYLSLEHELIARNTMIYENFINCNGSKEEIISIFKTSFIYKSLMMLKNFNHKDILKGDRKELLENTMIFLEYFKDFNFDDIENYYKKWENYFKKKSDEYIKEAYYVLETISKKEIKEAFHPTKYPSYKEYKSAKALLNDIHKKYLQ
jgi:hypothetical protein